MRFDPKIWLLFFFLFLSVQLVAQMQPSSYWSFEDMESNKNKCPLTQINGVEGKGIDLQNSSCLFVTSGLPRKKRTSFTVEFWFKGDQFQFLSVGHHHFLIRLTMSNLLFRTTHRSNKGDTVIQDLSIPLKGADRKSYSYYADQQWHHFVFVVDLEKGIKQVWVDALNPEGFSSVFNKNEQVLLSGDDGFRNTAAIDELRFYQVAVSGAAVLKNWQSTGNRRKLTTQQLLQGVDPREFAPGYPAYTYQAKEQLNHFPKPRFYSSTKLARNMSWMDINFLHRELPAAGGKGFGVSRPENAVAIVQELATNWNYYVEIPLLRTTPAAAQKAYSNPRHLAGSLIQFANQHPTLPTALITVQAQSIPAHFGMDSKLAYMRSQQLPARYFMKTANGNFILRGNRKIHSPIMPLDVVEKDAQVTAGYINLLMQQLHKSPALINENGEIFGHTIRATYLKQDPLVWKNYQQSGLSEAVYSGRFQFRIDSVYKKTVLEALKFSSDTRLSFYNLSAIQPGYWPAYSERRSLNKWSDSTYYSTPDFYPCSPDNWSNGRGALNGFGIISEGRRTELALGDKSFSPFVSAGWATEEKNIRPAQWLALLKSMVMLGADFFYTGYFNITGKDGKWPDGAGPNDPRGYIYQAAVPAYAQALRSWVPEFFTQGELLDPADYTSPRYSFRFKGNAENELILVRKWGKQYLIYGSVQPASNQIGNVPFQLATSIRVEDKTIQFSIRKQGSLYILDLSGEKPVFYQLDSWHQYEHPWYWSTTIQQDAATFQASTGNVKRITLGADGLNFTKAVSLVKIGSGGSVTYDGLSLETGSYQLKATVKALAPGARLECFFPETGKKMEWVVSPSQNDSIQTNIHLASSVNKVKWSVLEGTVELSHFSFEKK